MKQYLCLFSILCIAACGPRPDATYQSTDDEYPTAQCPVPEGYTAATPVPDTEPVAEEPVGEPAEEYSPEAVTETDGEPFTEIDGEPVMEADEEYAAEAVEEPGLIHEGTYTFSGISKMNGNLNTTTNGYPEYMKLYDDHLYIKFSETRAVERPRIYDGSGDYVYKSDDSYKYVFDSDFNLHVFSEFVASAMGVTMTFVNEQFYVKGEMPPPSSTASATSGYGNYGNTVNGTEQDNGLKLKRKTCTYCNGKGTVVMYGATTYGMTDPVWCDECRKMMPPSHYHGTCPSCKGKGYYMGY